MTEPPAEIREREGEGAPERAREEQQPDDDHEVGRPPSEQEGACGADGQRAQAQQTDRQSAHAAGERAAGTLGTRLGSSTPTRLTVTITTTLTATSPSRKGIDRRAFKPRHTREA